MRATARKAELLALAGLVELRDGHGELSENGQTDIDISRLFKHPNAMPIPADATFTDFCPESGLSCWVSDKRLRVREGGIRTMWRMTGLEPRYTTDLNAVMALLPPLNDGWSFSLVRRDGARWVSTIQRTLPEVRVYRGEALLPAAAICISALKAQADI